MLNSRFKVSQLLYSQAQTNELALPPIQVSLITDCMVQWAWPTMLLHTRIEEKNKLNVR